MARCYAYYAFFCIWLSKWADIPYGDAMSMALAVSLQRDSICIFACGRGYEAVSHGMPWPTRPAAPAGARIDTCCTVTVAKSPSTMCLAILFSLRWAHPTLTCPAEPAHTSKRQKVKQTQVTTGNHIAGRDSLGRRRTAAGPCVMRVTWEKKVIMHKQIYNAYYLLLCMLQVNCLKLRKACSCV